MHWKMYLEVLVIYSRKRKVGSKCAPILVKFEA